MNLTLVCFHERAEASDIQVLIPDVAQDLRAVAARFNALVEGRNRNIDMAKIDSRPGLSVQIYGAEEHDASTQPSLIVLS